MNCQGKVSQCMYSAAIQETASADGHRTGSEGGLLAQYLPPPKWGVRHHEPMYYYYRPTRGLQQAL